MMMTKSDGGAPARFDLSALAEQSKATTVRTSAQMNGPGNPFLDKVRASYEANKAEYDSGWQEIEMPSDQIDTVVTSLRALSTWFGKQTPVVPIGVQMRIEYQPDGASETIEVGTKDFDDIPRDGREVYFKYTGRERLKRGRKRSQPHPQQAATGQTDTAVDRDDDLVEDDELQPA
jgi:hypothetical protein